MQTTIVLSEKLQLNMQSTPQNRRINLQAHVLSRTGVAQQKAGSDTSLTCGRISRSVRAPLHLTFRWRIWENKSEATSLHLNYAGCHKEDRLLSGRSHRLDCARVHERRAAAADAAGAVPVRKQHSSQSKQGRRQAIAEWHAQRIAAQE